MAALGDQRPAALNAPDPVHRRMRSAVRFLAGHAQNLRLRLLHDLALFLDGGSVDEVFRIAEDDSGASHGFAQAPGFGHHFVQHLPLVVALGRPVEASQRLFHDDVLAGRRRLQDVLAVRRRRRADIQHIDFRQHLRHRSERANAVLQGERIPAFRTRRSHSHHLRAGLRKILQVEAAGEPGPRDADSDLIDHSQLAYYLV